MHIARILVSALRGGAGKTLLSLGLTRAFTRAGLRVLPCKKGPDYIDAAWLAHAAHRPATNLDPFFLSAEKLRALLLYRAGGCDADLPNFTDLPDLTDHTDHTNRADLAADALRYDLPDYGARPDLVDLALIEGNRGLFDGRDLHGSCSSAALAAALSCPVLLSLDCTKMTRTAAAIVQGLAHFDPQVRIGGVVLNQIATARQASLIRASIEHYTDIPVLGSLPRLPHNPLPERHMGLVAHDDPEQTSAILDKLADCIAAHVDLDKVLTLARSAPPLELAPDVAPLWPAAPAAPKVRIAYVKDAALWFYYTENLEALERAGAELVEISLLSSAPWPEFSGLYLGGGFPEECAEALSQSPKLALLRELSHASIPIYAECGGFMVLSKEIVRDSRAYPMANIFPVSAHFHPKPQGLGYVEARVTAPNPFHPQDYLLRGHEFHYSRAQFAAPSPTCLTLSTGTGMGNQQDGLLIRQTFASYTHIYAPAAPHWAINFVAAAVKAKAKGKGN